MSAALAANPIQVRTLEQFEKALKPEFQKIKKAVNKAKINSKTIKGYTGLKSLYNDLVRSISHYYSQLGKLGEREIGKKEEKERKKQFEMEKSYSKA